GPAERRDRRRIASLLTQFRRPRLDANQFSQRERAARRRRDEPARRAREPARRAAGVAAAARDRIERTVGGARRGAGRDDSQRAVSAIGRPARRALGGVVERWF